MAKVLIIEDEASLLEVYSEFLQSEGHEVLKATDGESGLKMASEGGWDILFLDVMLPNLDGIELLRELKTQGLLETKPVVMLTNLDNETVVSEALALGAKEHLNKAKINPQSLQNVILKYLSSSPQQEDGIEVSS